MGLVVDWREEIDQIKLVGHGDGSILVEWVEMVMNEMIVDLAGDREISTNLGGDGFSQMG